MHFYRDRSQGFDIWMQILATCDRKKAKFSIFFKDMFSNQKRKKILFPYPTVRAWYVFQNKILIIIKNGR